MLRKFIYNLRHVDRPRLRAVNGLLNLGVLAFGWFNLFLGAALFTQSATTNDFFIITEVFTHQFWGAIFLLGGISLLLGSFLNWWTMMRHTLLYLLFSEFVWIAALMYRQIADPASNLFLILFFALIAVLQVGLYVYFPIHSKVSTWKE